MRRISAVTTTIGAVIAALAILSLAGSAAAAPKHHHHRARAHVKATTHRPRHRVTRTRSHHSRIHKRARAAAARARRASTAAARTESRHLRSLVAGRSACLASLDPASQRLLALRAGLGTKARSAAVTARVLGVSRGREQLLEQISLLELKGDTGGACPAQATGSRLGPSARLTSTAPWLKGGAI